MKKSLLLSVIVLFIYSCGAGDNESSNGAKLLDFNLETTTKNPIDIFTTKYIKLETNENCIIGGVGKTISTDKYIFISDYRQDKLMVFDHRGKFVGNVGRKGKGPEEYIYLGSFSIDEYNSHVIISDPNTKKVLRYSLNNGFEFISSSEVVPTSGSIEVLKSGNIISNNSFRKRDVEMSKKDFTLFDKNYKVLNSYIEVDYYPFASTGPSTSLYKVNGNVFGYSQYESTIYKLSEKAPIPFYEISFGSELLAPLSFHQDNGETGFKIITRLRESGYIPFYSIRETSIGICIEYGIDTKDEEYLGFWDKESDKTYTYEVKDFGKQMQIGEFSNMSGTISDYFVTPINVIDVKLAIKEGTEINEELSNLIDESKEDDNPILMLFKSGSN